MKFVHLTPQPKIARVKRNGIRLGGGRRGKGVYAVPLMLMGRLSFLDEYTIVEAAPRSSTTLWHWLSSQRDWHRKLAVVTFKTSADHWPAILYLELKPTIGTNWLQNVQSNNINIADEDLQFVRVAHQQHFVADLKVTVGSAASLGRLLQAVQSAGLSTWDRYDETIEVVFPSPVPSSLITRITPLYRTNKQFKQHRQRQYEAG